jgi:hypothetical protein
MSVVIGSKQDALKIQKAMQNFIKEELKLDMKERKGLILSGKSEMAKYLGALVTYYGIRSVMETLSTEKVTSKQPDFNR